jgi:hypothetical protein
MVKIRIENLNMRMRKVAQGKNKMLVLNAVRAKLVLRMFAVTKFMNQIMLSRLHES